MFYMRGWGDLGKIYTSLLKSHWLKSKCRTVMECELLQGNGKS